MTDENNQVVRIKDALGGIAQAMLSLNDKGQNGLVKKMELYQLRRLDEVTKVEAVGSIEQEDAIIDTREKYEDLIGVCLISKDKVVQNSSDDRLRQIFTSVNSTAYNPLIKLGAHVANEFSKGAEADLDYLDLAKEAFIEGAKNSAENRRYALEALILFQKNGCDIDVAKLEDEILKAERSQESRETAIADYDTFVGTEFPDRKSNTRRYVDTVMGAINTVLNTDPTSVGWRANLMIVINHGVHLPDGVKGQFNLHNARMLRRNVENALLHAYREGGVSEKIMASQALKKMGSERIIAGLKDVVADERDQHGRLSEFGKHTLQLVQSMERIKTGKVSPPPPVRKNPRARVFA